MLTPDNYGNASSFSNRGYLLIASEIVGYTGKTSTTFTGVIRAVPPSNALIHTIGVNVVGINHLLFSSGVRSPITTWTSIDDTENIYNSIIVNYDGLSYTITDEGSINRYGKRDLDISTLYYFTQQHIVEDIANQYLESFKDLQQRIIIGLELSLYLNIGDVVLIAGEERNALIRIYELNHEFSNQQTTIVGRTITIPGMFVYGVAVWGTAIWGIDKWGTQSPVTGGSWDTDTWDGSLIWGS